jgi:hypothetical protein
MLTSAQLWFGFGSIIWLISLILTAGVLLSCLGLWVFTIRVHPQSDAGGDCDNVVRMDEQLVGGDCAHRDRMQELPAVMLRGSESEALRTA